VTDEELAAIRAYLRMTAEIGHVTDLAVEVRLNGYVNALLTELDRLRADNRHLEQVEMRLRDQRIQKLEAENAAMRPIVRAHARPGMDAFGNRAGGPWVWKCPDCGQQIGGEVMFAGKATTGVHSKTCQLPPAVDLVIRWIKEGEA
jgi:hypothetical protein